MSSATCAVCGFKNPMAPKQPLQPMGGMSGFGGLVPKRKKTEIPSKKRTIICTIIISSIAIIRFKSIMFINGTK